MYILLLPCVMMYYIVSGLLLMFFWCPCMAINVNVQYNGGFLPDIILWTQCHRAPVNLTAQSGENSVSAKKRLKNLLYKPIILNSEPHSAQTLQQQLLLLLLLLALRQNGTRDAHKISPHGTMTKRQL